MSQRTSRIRCHIDRPGFSLDVDVGWDERVAVVFGPSGSGKSTLFEIVLGLERCAGAHIRIGGSTFDDEAAGLHLPTECRDLGWVPQSPTLFPHLSVSENLDFGRARAADRDPAARKRAIEVLEIGDLLGRSIDQLSGGEAQRVAIARALASGPSALLLDEPLAALDLPLRARVLPYLMRVRDQLDLPILYITHDPDEAQLIGDIIVVLDAGRIVASGAPRDVLWSRAVLPLSEALGLENVFEGGIRREHGSPTFVSNAGLQLVLPVSLDGDTRVRIGLRAEDVVLAADRPGKISARNVLESRVIACDDRDGDVYVSLDAGEKLVAKVTAAAAAQLALAPGSTVYAIVKAQALRRLG
ncbi:MAG: molybdenum ABC transporter ATP-binding protein [Deltaproteobacteria bacterium]|nr:molybdenum ABC transporter ATP-binding protein [Deltaproteobacteria bacterium]